MTDFQGRTPRHIRERATDHSWPQRIAYFWHEWSWAITGLVAIFFMAGFGFKTPVQYYASINNDIDSKQAEIDTIRIKQEAALNDRIDQRRVLEFLARSKCSEMNENKKSELGALDICDAVNHPLDHAIAAHIRAPGEPLQ